MCYRIFAKVKGSHDWTRAGEFTSLQGALGELEVLTTKARKPTTYVVRNTRGEQVTKVVVNDPKPCTFWSLHQMEATAKFA